MCGIKPYVFWHEEMIGADIFFEYNVPWVGLNHLFEQIHGLNLR